jgi:hypothetical protein
VLLEGMRSWNWERPELDPLLALGWLMTAKVGGALPQRPVVYVVGQEGAGKSTLQGLIRLAMNEALVSTSNTTQAGIYQKVRQDSVAVMVDEMEAKEDTRTTDKILELARIAYSGDKMQRGGKDGVGQEFAVMSSFLFSSIALPAMGAQDASRMAILHMRERAKAAKGEPERDPLGDLGLRDGTRVRQIGRDLLARMLAWCALDGGRSRWDRLLEVMRAALIVAGHEARGPPIPSAPWRPGRTWPSTTPCRTRRQLEQWQQLLAADRLAETSTRQRTWKRCFAYLMDVQPDCWKHGPARVWRLAARLAQGPRLSDRRRGAVAAGGAHHQLAGGRDGEFRERAAVRADGAPGAARAVQGHAVGRPSRRPRPLERRASANARAAAGERQV